MNEQECLEEKQDAPGTGRSKGAREQGSKEARPEGRLGGNRAASHALLELQSHSSF